MVRKARKSVPVEEPVPVTEPEAVVSAPVVDDGAEETVLQPVGFDLQDVARLVPTESVQKVVEPIRVEKVTAPPLPTPEPVRESTPEEQKKKADNSAKAKVLQKIARYREQFDILRDYTINEYDNAEGLETQLNTIKMKIHSKKGVLFLKSVFMAGVGGWEFINTKANTLQLGGLTQMMGQSPDVDLLLRESQAEYGFAAAST